MSTLSFNTYCISEDYLVLAGGMFSLVSFGDNRHTKNLDFVLTLSTLYFSI